MSKSAISSVSAALGLSKNKTYYNDEQLAACVPFEPCHESALKDCWYTVTTVASAPKYGGIRTVGIFSSFQNAIEVLATNYGDIWENSYDLAFIESVRPNCLYGGHPRDREWYWFRYDQEMNGYQSIEAPPPGLEDLSAGGIG